MVNNTILALIVVKYSFLLYYIHLKCKNKFI